MDTENVILWQRHTKECEAEQCRNQNDRQLPINLCLGLMPRSLHGGRY